MNYKPKTGKNICCAICSKLFYIPINRFNTAKFCSSKCRGASSKKEFTGICEICNQSFDYIASREGKAKYCSRECYYKAMHLKGTVKNKCPECNNEFLSSPSQKRKYCSRKCMGESRINIFSFSHANSIRKGLKRKKLIKECHECGFNKEPDILGIHHKDMNRKNNNIENLVILCPNCHSIKHRKHIPHRHSS